MRLLLPTRLLSGSGCGATMGMSPMTRCKPDWLPEPSGRWKAMMEPPSSQPSVRQCAVLPE